MWNSDYCILESIKGLCWWVVNIDPNSCVTCRCAPPQSDKLITHFLNRLPDRSSSVATPCVCICLTPNSEPEKPLTSTHLGEHGQFFGKVDDTGDGRSDDLGELAEGLQVHLVSVWRGGDRGLADFVWLRGDRDTGRLIREQSQPDIDLSRGSPMRGRAEVNKCQKKKRRQQWTDSFIEGSAVCLESITHRPAHYRTKRVSVRSWK